MSFTKHWESDNDSDGIEDSDEADDARSEVFPSDLCAGSHLKVTCYNSCPICGWNYFTGLSLPPPPTRSKPGSHSTVQPQSWILSFQRCGKRLDLPNHALKLSSCFATRTWRS